MKKTFLLFVILSLSFMTFGRKIIKRPIPDRLVVLTFDDATASHYSFVAPLLKKYGFGGTFFVCEFPPHFSDTSKYMNWRQIRELDRMGFEVANHTRNHPAIGRLTDTKIDEEIHYIERKCDSTGIAKPTSFAYPGYSLSMPVIHILQKKAYTFARAGGNRAYDPLTDHPLLIPSWALNSDNEKQMTEVLGQARDGKIVIMTIHGVPDMEHPWVNTSPQLFEEYLQFLYDNHFKVIALRDLHKYINTNEAFKTLIPDLNKKLK
jgi:peptidoglycan-N-acetylglucosamine deacetylase